ncbi:MAG: dihydropteroate synthase [Betaproteobacteria bacterium]|nr:dihydropteroate synthase [Betaproteobacteria bacterium]
MTTLRCGHFSLSLDRPLIMGIVNVTPDSFSDGGRYLAPESAIAHSRQLVAEGAALLDIGGESTRPGARPVGDDEEWARLAPVLEGIVSLGVPVSVDTCKPEVMKRAIAAGAAMINDVMALRTPGTLEAVADSEAAVCLMHMRGEPRTMQQDPRYDDVVREVADFLRERVDACEKAGIGRERIVVDPGFGFGKTVEHNLQLLRALDRIAALGLPVLAGLSRKSTLGKITGRAEGERIFASVAAAVLAAQKGAKIIRVHDVAATKDALAVWNAYASAA